MAIYKSFRVSLPVEVIVRCDQLNALRVAVDAISEAVHAEGVLGITINDKDANVSEIIHSPEDLKKMKDWLGKER